MFDIGLVQQVVLDLAALGRIEGFLLYLGVHLQRRGDLTEQGQLLAGVFQLFVFVEPALHLAVVLFEQPDRQRIAPPCAAGAARTGAGRGMGSGLMGRHGGSS